MKKILALALATAVAAGSLGVAPAEAYTDPNLGSNKIGRVGNATKSIYKGGELDLEVRKGTGLRENDIKWSISNTNILRFDDDDRYDDEIELRALKAGTAKITCKNALTGGKLVYNVTVKEGSGTISRVGSSSRTIEVGDDAELKVKKSGLTNSQIKWSVSDSSILRFEDGDNIGTEVEVEGKKVGTAKVYAKNLKTGGKITYTIKVVPDYDDDWDDDDK